MFAALLRLFKTEPALLGSVGAAVYAAAVMLWRAFVDHSAPFDTDVAVAAVVAVYGIYVRLQVTPLARPRDKRNLPLTSR